MIDHEVDIGKFEQSIKSLGANDNCIGVNGSFAAVKQRDGKRNLLIRIDCPADNIGSLVAIKA